MHGFAGLAVARGVLAGVDFLQGVVGVFDEVAEEEGGGVWGWGLELRVGFEGPGGRGVSVCWIYCVNLEECGRSEVVSLGGFWMSCCIIAGVLLRVMVNTEG